ncbi:trypsin [Danio aesculapii]|uniref:trypsin n=1 Tax=Danio aesculapii TaxID=1142201 RepID=UPI0024C0A193|nr:trypsin [Danio aesculapii]
MKMMLRLAVCVAGVVLLNISGSLCQLDVCGRAPLKPRIVGGQNAVAGSWPWQVTIHYIPTGGLICGGTLINREWVLSAAQCFKGFTASTLVVHLGHLKLGDPNVIYVPGSQIINHPNYDSNKNKNDIALLKLSSPVNFNDYVRPVCLTASGSSIGKGAVSWITGFGTTNTGGTQFPITLQEAKIPVVSNSDCKSAYGSLITDGMICAGPNEGGKGICIGDGGGPLIHNSSDQWIQSGIASFGRGCAQPKNPGVFTRVSEYESWIKSQISKDQPGFIKLKASASSASFSVFLIALIPLIHSLFS